MSKKDFAVRRFVKNGVTYEFTPFGEWLKDGVPFKAEIKNDQREGHSGKKWVCDGSHAIAPVRDFGFLSNTDPSSYEQIGSTKTDVENGVELRTRCIYRTEDGMKCKDNVTLYEADGVTKKKSWIEENAEFEAIGDKAEE